MEQVKKNFGLIILVLLGLIPLVPFFHVGFPVTHDGQDHIARIANFYQSLSEGNIIPRWAANLNWGYGHPILMFLYPFPSYLASFFHVLGFSLVDSVKLVFGLSYILSGIAMYLWIRNIFGEKAGVLSGLLYMYAPYRFVDLYVRGAIGEHVAFVFAPLIFYFLLKISKRSSYWSIVGGALSLAGLLLSHNALALMFLPIAMLYASILVKDARYKKRLIANFLIVMLTGFSLASFFIIPAFFEGKYTLRDIVTNNGEYKQGFVSLMNFVNLSWSYGGTAYLSKQIGIVQIVGVILGTICLVVSKKDYKRLLYVILIIPLILSLFLMLPYSNFLWENISLIQKFQFPWRLLSVVVFTSAALSSFIFIDKKRAKLFLSITIFMGITVVILYYPYYKANGYLTKPESFYTGVYKSTTDTGESSPIWSVRFMERAPLAPTEIIDGTATIKKIDSNTTTRKYEINVSTDKARVRENTLYFPNWEVSINGEKTDIEFQDRANRGLITYYVPKGKNNVAIVFKDTKLRILSNVLSLVSLIVLIGLFFFKKTLSSNSR